MCLYISLKLPSQLNLNKSLQTKSKSACPCLVLLLSEKLLFAHVHIVFEEVQEFKRDEIKQITVETYHIFS